MSVWYGEPRPIADIPVGIYARVDTVCAGGGTSCATPNVNTPFDPNTWRLIKTLTTSADGAYEILLPSTETWNCPIPQGPCPGMYIAIVDDPGTKDHPNANYNPNLLTANTPFEVWPGLTTQLDTPVDPISGTACEDPAGGAPPIRPLPPSPSCCRSAGRTCSPVTAARRARSRSRPTSSASRPPPARPGTVRLTDWRDGTVTNLTPGNGGIVSWTPGPTAGPGRHPGHDRHPGSGDQHDQLPARAEAADDHHRRLERRRFPASTASPCTCSAPTARAPASSPTTRRS